MPPSARCDAALSAATRAQLWLFLRQVRLRAIGRRSRAFCNEPATCDPHGDPRTLRQVRDEERATAFVARAMAGAYGPSRPTFARAVTQDGRIAGIILGCEVFPPVGFVLYVAVRPEFQSRGIGTSLMRGLAREFRTAGLREMALGVTASSPAKRLYERLGFETRRTVDAYYWWTHTDTI